MIHRTLILTHHKPHMLYEDDIIKRVDGGIEVTWHSSPGTTTFYPYHRVWEYQEIDTEKTLKIAEADDTADDSML